MTSEEETVLREASRRRWREQQEIRLWLGLDLLMILANIGGASFMLMLCFAGSGLLNLVAVAMFAYNAVCSLSSYRRNRRLLKARAVFCASMDGLLEAVKAGNAAAFNHHDDQSDAALAEMRRLSEINSLRPRWR